MRTGIYRFLAAALSVSIVALTCFSCVRVHRTEAGIKNTAVQRLSSAYRCGAEIQYNGGKYRVNISRLGAGNCAVSFVEPAVLSGLSYTLKGSELTIQYQALGASPAVSAMPETSLIRVLSAALDAAAKPEGLKAGHTGETAYISGHLPAGKFTLTLGEGCVPQKLSIPAAGIEAVFNGVAFKK